MLPRYDVPTVLIACVTACVAASCFYKKPPPRPKPATTDQPESVLECMDRCKPDGVHLYQPCYEACTRYVETKAEYDDAARQWERQKDAVPPESVEKPAPPTNDAD